VATQLILLGAGGHAKVLLSLARAAGLPVVGVCDGPLSQSGAREWRGVPVIGGDDALDSVDPSNVGLINGVGQLVGKLGRRTLHERMKKRGFQFPALVHPAAVLDPTAVLREGVQVMAGAVVQADASIDESSIVNTRASVDHDCVVGPHVHIAPGATLCGGVRVLEGAFVASGATVAQGVTIGRGCVVGAGVTLVRDLPDGQTVLGPAVRVQQDPETREITR
jgi:sugar O-acyltransferase (sialic acid O-acetyltransferase NeuD family)